MQWSEKYFTKENIPDCSSSLPMVVVSVATVVVVVVWHVVLKVLEKCW